MAEESVLARFGLTMDEFVKRRQDIGDSLFERAWGEIARLQIGCDLLMCGFDENGAHIFCVSNPTADNPSFITYYDSPGFAAIGTGSYLAESTLYAYHQNTITNLSKTIYHATVAKFIAESASDVGEQTMLLVFGKNGKRFVLPDDLEDRLRVRWWKKGRPTIPSDALEMIDSALENVKKPEK